MKLYTQSAILYFVIYFIALSNLIGQDNTWLTDITQEVGFENAKGSRILCVDINNDNYPDLFWGTGNAGKNTFKLMMNVENPDQSSSIKRIFVDRTEESNVNVNRNPEKTGRIVDVAAFADVDNDGDLDLVTAIYYHRWEYYDDETKDPGDRCEVLLNDGNGNFSLVQENGLYNLDLPYFMTLGLTNATGLSFLDYDYDGIVDLYISTWFKDYKNNVKMTDILTKGNGDGSFTFVPNSGIERISQPMYGVNVTDWNNDGWQDIVTSAYCRSGGSLFENNKDGTFDDVSLFANYSGQKMGGDHGQDLCQWEAQAADFDNDGDMDFLQVSVHGGYDAEEGRTHITINRGEEKDYRLLWDLDRITRDAPSNSHLGDQGGSWFDLDNDGLLDLAICQMAYPAANTQGQERLYICRQNEDNFFDDISHSLDIFHSMKEAHSIEPADFDLDGDLDLFVSRQIRDTITVDTTVTYNTYMQVILLRNDIGNINNWVSVKTNPPADANQGGFGTRITVYSGGVARIREIQGGLGHFSGQQPRIRNFGLGDVNYIDSIIVRWPNKNIQTTTIINPPLNLILNIDENGYRGYIPTWKGSAPVITYSKPFLDFGTVNVGDSKDLEIYLKNIGDAPLVLDDLSFVKAASSFDFVTDIDPQIIVSGDSIKLMIRFTPENRNDFKTELSVASNAANKRLLDIFATGFNPEPLIEVDSEIVTFDTVYVGNSEDKAIMISNIGEKNLVINSISILGANNNLFLISNVEFPLTIPAGEFADVTLRFEPITWGNFTAQLEINSNAYNEPKKIIDIEAIGDGPKAVFDLSKKLFLFGKVPITKTKSFEFDIENEGDGELKVDDIYFTGDTEVFSINDITFPILIEPEGTYPLTISFNPIDMISYDGYIYFVSNSYPESEAKFYMSGTGVDSAGAVSYNDIEGLSLQVIPNPILLKAQLVYENSSLIGKKVNVFISDISGRKVKDLFNGTLYQGITREEFDVQDINSGTYLLTVISGNNILVEPIIILK